MDVGNRENGTFAERAVKCRVRGWHCGSGSKGSGNNTHIGVEMCEPTCIKYRGGANFTCSDTVAAKVVAKRTYEAAVELFAYLCRQVQSEPDCDGVNQPPGRTQPGGSSNHGDTEHLRNGLGMGYIMDGFRKAVKAAMDGSAVSETEEGGWYRVRKSWADAKSQKGAFKVFANAKKCAGENPGYSVYNESGKGVFIIVEEAYGQGASRWGKLKSGTGWISLDYAKRI